MKPLGDAYHHQLNPLIDKLYAGTMTLEECYALYRWLKVVYLDNPDASMQDKALATHVQASVQGRIIDMLHAEEAP